MTDEAPYLDRALLRKFLESAPGLMPVKAAPEGRFIIPVPDFGDGKGPVLAPNIKEIEAKIRGSDGEVESVEIEAGPQKIPADGTNVIVINRVDEFVQLALKAKLDHLIERNNGEMSRAVLDEFMSYARGYSYDPETQEISFTKNIGFRNDVYNMSLFEFKRRYVRHSSSELSLKEVKDENILAGYYIKKQLFSKVAWLDGKFHVKVAEGSGDTVQSFERGAMVNLPEAPDLPLSFVHSTDINTCYIKRDGSGIIDAKGKHELPRFDAAETQKNTNRRNT